MVFISVLPGVQLRVIPECLHVGKRVTDQCFVYVFKD